jgi:dihydropyrimidinase
MSLLIKSGTLITADRSFQSDILVDGEKISRIDLNIPSHQADQVIDATGKFILPGGVDAHVHLDLPMAGTVSSDDHYTGTKAAAFGGTTTVIDFISQDVQSLLRNVESWHSKADSKIAVDIAAHINITHLDDQVEVEIPTLVGEGITSLKVFTAYNHRLRLQDGEIFRVLRIAAKHGLLTMIHAENGDVIEILVHEALEKNHKSPEWHARTRPAWGAVESALRGAALAQMANAPLYIVHMNAGGEVDMLEYARSKGLPILGETCPQYLFFTEDELRRQDGAKWVCSPPVRTKEDQKRIWKGLESNTLQVLATDHCPFFFDGTKEVIYEGKPVKIPGKELGKSDFTLIPNGLPGVGDRLPVFWTKAVGEGRISANQFVAFTSTNPAKIFGLFPRKGALLPGSDADIVIWDPEKETEYGWQVAQHRTDYNLYEGWKLKGFPEQVFLRGKCIVDHQQWFGKAGMGRFVNCSSYKLEL